MVNLISICNVGDPFIIVFISDSDAQSVVYFVNWDPLISISLLSISKSKLGTVSYSSDIMWFVYMVFSSLEVFCYKITWEFIMAVNMLNWLSSSVDNSLCYGYLLSSSDSMVISSLSFWLIFYYY
jgi:hypothetical protein